MNKKRNLFLTVESQLMNGGGMEELENHNLATIIINSAKTHRC